MTFFFHLKNHFFSASYHIGHYNDFYFFGSYLRKLQDQSHPRRCGSALHTKRSGNLDIILIKLEQPRGHKGKKREEYEIHIYVYPHTYMYTYIYACVCEGREKDKEWSFVNARRPLTILLEIAYIAESCNGRKILKEGRSSSIKGGRRSINAR